MLPGRSWPSRQQQDNREEMDVGKPQDEDEINLQRAGQPVPKED